MKKKIGSYQIQKTIGKGTFGLVKQAVHLPTSEKVAIKILEKSRIVDSKDKRNIIQELSILKKMNHRNIIRLYELIESDKKIYIATQFVEGGELYQNIINRGKLDEKIAKRYFWQLMQGLKYLHENNIVHRDLKPENVMISDDHTIKIIDFGLGRYYGENQKLSTSCGSPCYAAPEMVSGAKYVPTQVDIWSSGIILYGMICGCLPFEDSNYKTLYAKVLKGRYDVPNHLSEQAKDLLAGIINTQPTKRFTIQNILGHPWLNNVADMTHIQEEITLKALAYPLLQRVFNLQIQEIIEETEKLAQSALKTHLHLLMKQLSKEYRHRSKTVLKYRSSSNNRKRIISEVHAKPASVQIQFKGLMNLSNLLDGQENDVKKQITAAHLKDNVVFKGQDCFMNGKIQTLNKITDGLFYLQAPFTD